MASEVLTPQDRLEAQGYSVREDNLGFWQLYHDGVPVFAANEPESARMSTDEAWIDSATALLRRVEELEREREDLWEYVFAMEAANIAIDEGTAPDTERINVAQEKLKARWAPTTKEYA